MKIIRESNENEFVFNFLAGELNSARFKDDLKKSLSLLNLSEFIITNANLGNEKENTLRKELLGQFRGYGKNIDLFENFPQIESYKLCEFTNDDLKNIYYINYSYWNELSDYTSLPMVAAKNILNGKTIFDVSNESFLHGAEKIVNGEKFPPMIFLTYDYTSFIILEGHSRMTIFALQPDYFKNVQAFVLKCSKDELDKWNK